MRTKRIAARSLVRGQRARTMFGWARVKQITYGKVYVHVCWSDGNYQVYLGSDLVTVFLKK